MIYTIERPSGRIKVDTDLIAEKFLYDGTIFICPSDFKERVRLIELLEEKGFCCAKESGSSSISIIESKFPLIVKLKEKTVSCMGNNTAASAAVSSGLVISSREFYLIYSIYLSLEDSKGVEIG